MIARWFAGLAAAIWLLAVAAPASADITNVSPSPASASVIVPGGAVVTLVWQVTRFNNTGQNTVTLRSPAGTFRIGGAAVASVDTVLSRSLTTPRAQTGVATISETVVVPRRVVLQMVRNPGQTATYSRTFADESSVTASASVTLIPAGDSAAAFDIKRIDLTFADRSRVKVLPADSELFALAEIDFGGSGVAQLEWQVADPAGTRGALTFRRLRIQRQALSGGGHVTLRSPPLPSRLEGLHIVRLVVTDPELPFEVPDLKYFVVPEEGAASAPAGQRMTLLEPPENAVLSAGTRFAWDAVPGAVVYQVEVYPLRPKGPVGPAEAERVGGELLIDPDELTRRPLTGVALPARQTDASLRRYSLARLRRGESYLWRVTAIAGNGAVIGVSPLRRITAAR